MKLPKQCITLQHTDTTEAVIVITHAPFSKSEWMTPAACGAVIPFKMVHAFVSVGPDDMT